MKIQRDQKLSDYGINSLIGTPFWESLQKKFNEIGIEDLEDKFEDGGINQVNLDVSKSEDSSIDKKIRDSKVLFLEGEDYGDLSRQLFDLVQEYNQNHSNWKYDIAGIEYMQYGVYCEGGFYDWHMDIYSSPQLVTIKKSLTSSSKLFGNRKISVSIFLNDPDEYEGGELDIETRGPRSDPRYHTFKLSKGSIVVFPSNKWHRVRPITSGVRKSLVAWFLGPPFR